MVFHTLIKSPCKTIRL